MSPTVAAHRSTTVRKRTFADKRGYGATHGRCAVSHSGIRRCFVDATWRVSWAFSACFVVQLGRVVRHSCKRGWKTMDEANFGSSLPPSFIVVPRISVFGVIRLPRLVCTVVQLRWFLSGALPRWCRTSASGVARRSIPSLQSRGDLAGCQHHQRQS